ncbi:MAG: LuxR C-terminal-related transcriptional regulator [Pseudomonadota bacterium]
MDGIERTGHRQSIDRPRLTERFLAGLSRRLTLLEAPLGYGKTTLIEAWVTHLGRAGHPVASVAFDAPARQSINRMNDALAQLSLHHDEDLGLKRLPGEVGPEARRFLILDDFHEADGADCAFVQNLLRGADQGLHLVIGTREPPGFPLTKLRMADQVTDFTRDDLRFDQTEAEALFQDDLPLSEVNSYLEKAEGWIAALQLLRQFGLKRDGPPPDFDRLTQLGEYLNEQYYEQLSPAQQFTLLSTAHVDRVDGDLANWLTGRSDGWQELSALAAANALIFAETGAETTRYRYHSLLRDYLRRKQQQLGQSRMAELHRGASEWFEANAHLVEAMKHARLAGDGARVKDLLLAAGGVQYGMLQGAARLSACLDTLTPEQVLETPRLLLVRAYILLKTGRIREAMALLEEIRATAPSDNDELEREIVLIEAHGRIYSDANMARRQLEALEHTFRSTPPTDPLTRGMLSNFLCMFFIEFGDFPRAREFGDQAMAIYRDMGAAHLQFFMHLHLSAIDLEIRGLAPARAARQRALDLCSAEFATDPSLRACAEIYHGETEFEAGATTGLAERLRASLLRIDRMEGWNMLYLAGYETCLSLLIEDGSFDAAVELCEHAGNLAARRGMVLFPNQLLSLQLDLAVRAGARREARRLAGALNLLLSDNDRGGLRWRGRVRAELAMARFEAETGAERAALDRITRMVRYCRGEGLIRLEMRALVRKLALEAKLEDVEAGFETLKSYIALARQHGGVGAVLRERTAFKEAVLWLVTTQGVGAFDPSDIRFLALLLWNVTGEGAAGQGDILAELLTEKEVGVLDELAKGAANKVIARALQITEPTVKFHLQNIYRKLGVNSRKLAVEIAREHRPPTG